MVSQDLVKKSLMYGMIGELFAETLSDLPQKLLYIDNENDIDFDSIFSQLASDDVLVTNENYSIEKADFQVLNCQEETILTIAPCGTRVNNHNSEFYLEDNLALQKLISLYNNISHSGRVFTITLR